MSSIMRLFLSLLAKRDFARPLNLDRTLSKIPFYQQSFPTFGDMVNKEKQDSKKFIVIEDKCSSIGYYSQETLSQVLDTAVEEVFRFAVGPRSLALVKVADVDHFLKTFSPSQDDQLFPVHSRILKMTRFPKNVSKIASEDQLRNISLGKIMSDKRLDIVRKNPDPEQAIRLLTESCSMTEFGCKLRFIFLNHLQETICSGIFSHFLMLPFGSSVNGFGDDYSDFDVVMLGNNSFGNLSDKPHPNLSYLSKPMTTERFQSQRLVDFVGDQLQFFTPGVMSVTRVPKARVPIVKLYSDIFALDCDISFSQDNAVEMAQALFMYSKMDIRVKQLASFIKLWAKSQSLTNPSPGPWLTNFELMMMIINFFQTRNRSSVTLPPMNSLNSMPTEESTNVIEEDTSFVNILREFFEYLEEFDYANYGMSILQGKIVVKPHHDVLYIENPTEPDLNVCKNVSKNELIRLITSVRASLTIIDGKRDFSLSDLCTPFTKNTSSSFISFHNKNRGSKGIKVNDYLIDDTKQ